MIDTIQNSLKQIYYALGGNVEDLRDTNDVNTILLAIARTLENVMEKPSDPTDGAFLVYDGESSEWQSKEVPQAYGKDY
jgi:hypothetical protein